MFNKFDEEDEDKKILNEENENSKYFVEEEEIATVFKKATPKKELIEDEVVPQDKEGYIAKSQLIMEETSSLAPINVSTEMRKSFLEYAMSVIVSRALPDARDGLKPVHRRILYGMHDLGITSSTPHKKSARIVGDVLGKYHPHGDSAVYESMVRMSQEFSMRYPLIDGHGNFGSIDGDGAAAMRYTEARMSKIAAMLVDGIRKDTVDFVPNYDGSEQEPSVLPARFPNLLVSGTTGIAVGMATSIPPHNLTDIIDATIHLAHNPDVPVETLIDFVKAPDFPTGALILGIEGARKAYMTGKGSVTIRSKTHIEEMKNGKTRIIVTEIPYMVNKARMIEKMAHLVKDKVVEGITDLRDESSRKGIRIVIELRRDIVPEVMQNKLFKLTQLQTNFSINLLSLVGGAPKIMNLKESLEVYIKHQTNVFKRKTQFDLNKTLSRSHVLEGLKIATQNIDEVIKIVRASATDVEAQLTLRNTFELSEIQAKAITDMKLGRLTGLAIEKMDDELGTLKTQITYFENILQNRSVLIDKIIEELEEVKARFGDERRSEIVNGMASIEDEDLIPVEDIAITMSSRGYVKRIPLESYQIQNRGGVGARTMSTYEDDNVEKILTTTTHTDLLIFTALGKVYRIRAHQIPEMSKTAKGIPFLNIIGIQKGEKVISLKTTNSYDDDEFLFTITKRGVIKKTALSEYSRINRNGKKALGLKPNDELVKAIIGKDSDEIIIGSSKGKVVRFQASEVRAMGRTASGVRGIDLSDDPKTIVVGASIASESKYILSVGQDGFGKKTIVSDYRKTKRGAKGVKSIDTKKAGYLKFVEVVHGDEDILIITKAGITIRTSLAQVATSGRSAKGVKVISLRDGNAIKAISVINIKKINEAVEEAITKTQEISIQKIKELNESSPIREDNEEITED